MVWFWVNEMLVVIIFLVIGERKRKKEMSKVLEDEDGGMSVVFCMLAPSLSFLSPIFIFLHGKL